MKNYYYTVDIGGTNIKGAIVSSDNKILEFVSLPTIISNDKNYLTILILNIISCLFEKTNLDVNGSLGLGLSIPGTIDSKNGIICTSNNLNLHNYKIVDELKKHISVPIKIANDATVASLAEFKLGSAKNYKTFLYLSLGTGIGGEFFVNGLPYSSFSQFSGEFGHIKLNGNKHLKCACGEFDCFEKYASTSALVLHVRDAMLNNKNSKMWQTYDEKSVNGKTVFDYINKDETATAVFQKYIEYLGDGLVSIVNILSPEIIVVGGAISNQKTLLTKPLENYVNEHKFTKNIKQAKLQILPAALGDKSGALGAKLLFDEEDL